MSLNHKVEAYGPLSVVARVRWAPSSASIQTITESVGVKNVTRSAAGSYSVNLLPGMKSILAMLQVIDTSDTVYHWTEVSASSVANGTVSVRHRSKAFASVAGAPDASDTVDQLEVIVFGRLAS